MKNIKKVFEGTRFAVGVIEILGRNKKKISREMVIHPGAVVILPIFDINKIILIRNERFAVGKTLWELPAGTLESEESPLETASRELVEETGYESINIKPLITFYTTPGFCNEIMHAFVATDLIFVGQQLEDSEKIEPEIVEWSQALAMIQSGEICDGKTITTLLYYFNRPI
jgi:ADP-ribose pyrophosphatase